MGQSKNTVLQTVDLSVSYGLVSALKNASVVILEGEFVSLIGANGAGKSTFLEAVLGLHKPETGKILFKGEDITGRSTERIVASGIVLCPEGRGILPLMSVMENLQLGAFHNRRTMVKSLTHVFDVFPILGERKHQIAGTLSGGQQQMLSIGRALMAAPTLMMLDEPSLGLAPLVVEDILRIIGKLAREGHSILLSEQNAKKALQYAEKAYVFETGNIVAYGRSQDLMSNEVVVRAYLGS